MKKAYLEQYLEKMFPGGKSFVERRSILLKFADDFVKRPTSFGWDYQTVVLLADFFDRKDSIYSFSGELSRSLSESDGNVSMRYVQRQTFSEVKNYWIETAVKIEGLDLRALNICLWPDSRIQMVYYFEHDGVMRVGFSDLSISKDFTGCLEDVHKLLKSNQGDLPENQCYLFGYGLKCLTYLFSGRPDVREWKCEPVGVNKKERRVWREANKEMPSIPAILVGMNWKKEKSYSVSQFNRRGHWRWQPCGKERSEVKLIYIPDAVVNPKNVKQVV